MKEKDLEKIREFKNRLNEIACDVVTLRDAMTRYIDLSNQSIIDDENE